MVPLSKKHSITTVDKSASRGNLFFQPKLTINAPDDIYEKEADAVADRVVQSKTAGVSHFFKPVNISMLQRKCAHCEEEEKRKAQRKEQNGNTVDAPESVEQYLGGLNNSGSSLSTSTQDFFQSQMGYNFSDVKIHTGSIAAKSAQSINALAYTSGNNIVFNEGQYQPNTNTGKRLLAHELTHVVQQRGVVVRKVQRSVTDERLGGMSESQMASSVPSSCGNTVKTCYGRCQAADNSIGVCQWGGITYGCRCRSNRGAEPAPVARSVPWWVWALGAAAALAIAACFATGVCEAGIVIGAVGATAAAGVIVMLRAAGINVLEDTPQST